MVLLPFWLVADGLWVEDVGLDPLEGEVGGRQRPLRQALDGLRLRELRREGRGRVEGRRPARARRARPQERVYLEGHDRPREQPQRARVLAEVRQQVAGGEEPDLEEKLGLCQAARGIL